MVLPTGIKNCFEGGCPRCLTRSRGDLMSGESLDRCLCTHAEANAIMQCALFGNAGQHQNTPLYTPRLLHASNGSKMVISVGIRRIVVLSDYPEDGTQLLKAAKIEFVKLDPDLLRSWTTLII